MSAQHSSPHSDAASALASAAAAAAATSPAEGSALQTSDVVIHRKENEGFGFVIISSLNRPENATVISKLVFFLELEQKVTQQNDRLSFPKCQPTQFKGVQLSHPGRC